MKDEIKEILDRLEIVARKHTIEICDDGNIETLPASIVDELRLNNYSSKLLLDYITNLQEENERLKTNWQVAQEDLEHILKLLGLELGDTIYDIENKILELKGEDK